MSPELEQKKKIIYDTLTECEKYSHAVHVLNFDEETICPEDAMEEQGELISFLSNKAFVLMKDRAFEEAVVTLHENNADLDDSDKPLIDHLYRDYLQTKNVTPEQDLAFRKVYSKAFVDWLSAKKAADFSLFRVSLAKVKETQLKEVSLWEYEGEKPASAYNALLNAYERGVTTDDLDKALTRLSGPSKSA